MKFCRLFICWGLTIFLVIKMRLWEFRVAFEWKLSSHEGKETFCSTRQLQKKFYNFKLTTLKRFKLNSKNLKIFIVILKCPYLPKYLKKNKHNSWLARYISSSLFICSSNFVKIPKILVDTSTAHKEDTKEKAGTQTVEQ